MVCGSRYGRKVGRMEYDVVYMGEARGVWCLVRGVWCLVSGVWFRLSGA
jgi:hypothetical protein